jgi:hypothetical protein
MNDTTHRNFGRGAPSDFRPSSVLVLSDLILRCLKWIREYAMLL